MKPKAILFYFSDEWGEIDTVLPLVRSIKSKTNLKIIILIKKDSTFQKKEKFLNLFKFLKKNSDIIIYPSFFPKYKRVKQYLKPKFFFNLKNILLLLIKILRRQELGIESDWIKYEILKKYNLKYFCNTAGTIIENYWFDLYETKFLIVPHAPTFKGGKLHSHRTCNLNKHDLNRIRKFIYYRRYPSGTKFFTNNYDEKIFYKKYLPNNLNIVPIGFTRLEKKWVELIKSDKKIIKKSNQILILLGKTSYIGISELKSKLNDILYIADKFKYNVKYKFHPKSTFNINDIIKKFSKLKIEESVNSVMYDALDSDITISTSKSGACLDSIAVDVPVIEYYSYSNGVEINMQNEFKINGKVMSLFRYYGLVESIDNIFDLEKFIKKIKLQKTFKKKIILKQKKALNKIAYNKNQVTKKFLKNI